MSIPICYVTVGMLSSTDAVVVVVCCLKKDLTDDLAKTRATKSNLQRY